MIKSFFEKYGSVIRAHKKPGGTECRDNIKERINDSASIFGSLRMHYSFIGIAVIDTHSFEPHKREDYELIAPVNIGNNVWIATGAIICPGVTIGDNAVIGTGSVVTKDIPPNVFACGVPCCVVREITEEDRLEINI